VTSSTDLATAPSSANSRMRQPDTYWDSFALGWLHAPNALNGWHGRDLCLTRPPLHSRSPRAAPYRSDRRPGLQSSSRSVRVSKNRASR
jgi:hypothetical protein